MNWEGWDKMSEKQRRQDKWFVVALFVFLVGALLVTLHGCTQPKPPPVTPTPDADAGGFVPQPLPNANCDAVCATIKQRCAGVGAFCACYSVTNPSYAACLQAAMQQASDSDACAAASACDTGK